jgi:hypothetical protein
VDSIIGFNVGTETWEQSTLEETGRAIQTHAVSACCMWADWQKTSFTEGIIWHNVRRHLNE